METLHDLLAGAGEVGVRELRDALGDLCSDAKTARITAQQKLRRPHIYRIEIEDDGVTRSVIVKRLSPEIAQRNERVVREWLPAVGLADAGPPLLGVAAERTGVAARHLPGDLGPGPRLGDGLRNVVDFAFRDLARFGVEDAHVPAAAASGEEGFRARHARPRLGRRGPQW